VVGPEIRPLGQIRLAEHDRAGGPQFADEERVRRVVTDQRERSGGRVLAIARTDIVLSRTGIPSSALRAPCDRRCASLATALAQGVWVRLDDGMQ